MIKRSFDQVNHDEDISSSSKKSLIKTKTLPAETTAIIV
jgi:hypothetical protein